jgi:rhodanese-related sulfurtransferase
MSVSAQQLRAMLLDGEEIALLDVREEAEFGARHILLAVNLPLSRLELRAANLVPRTATRVVVCDGDGDGRAHRAAARLEFYGYSAVQVLGGGTQAWADAGYEVFSGVNVPSKLFGEFIEHHYATPSLSAEELKARMDAGADMVVLDSRPLAEYREMNIPGSTCVPGAELVYRVRELAPHPNTLVVVNCAGRTRSIIGAQSLINAGIPNRVLALRNGTMGWHLAGLELEHGQDRYLPAVSPDNAEEARHLAARVASRFGVRTVDRQTLTQWQQAGDRSLYLLDVRSPEEFASGHLPGSQNAPGGQLVQGTDRYVGTLRARVVLIDDNAVRATMTASWLNQMGLHEALVLERALLDATLLRGPQPYNALGIDALRGAGIDAATLAGRIAGGKVALLDLQRSVDFRKGHIAGALHAVRGRLHERAADLAPHELLVLSSDDGLLARYAFDEATRITDAEVAVLQGGNAAWQAAGHLLVGGNDGLEDAPVDTFLRPYDRDRSVEEAMQSYLDWEIALLDRLEHDGTLRFRTA